MHIITTITTKFAMYLATRDTANALASTNKLKGLEKSMIYKGSVVAFTTIVLVLLMLDYR